jgi:hypothetical protein
VPDNDYEISFHMVDTSLPKISVSPQTLSDLPVYADMFKLRRRGVFRMGLLCGTGADNLENTPVQSFLRWRV